MVRRQELPETEGQGLAPDDFIVTSRELKEVGICFEGQKTWFPDHGFDLKDVVKNGVKASAIEATGEGIALKAIQRVRTRRGL